MNKDKAGENELPEENTEKYFNEGEYSTVTVKKEEDGTRPSPLKEENFVKALLNLLDSGSAEDKDSALDLLKKENAVAFLLEAVTGAANTDKKAVLLAACWETGLDFRGHHHFFMEYALHPNPLISLEAITVLDTNRESIPATDIEGLMDRLSEAIAKKHDNAALLEDLKLALYQQLKGD